MTFPAKTTFTFNHTGQPPYPQQSTAITQGNLDARGNELLTYINSIVSAYLSQTADASGAKYIGVESINGVAGNTAQDFFESLKSLIDGVVAGQIPAGSIGIDALNFVPALSSALTSHTGNTSNPHSVTAGQVGAAVALDVQEARIRSYMGV